MKLEHSEQNTAQSARQVRKPLARKREELREHLWPGSESVVWDRRSNDGFATIPRLLPLIVTLIQSHSQKGDTSSVYYELWSRSFEEGIVSVTDEEEHAFCAGYTGPRAVRTWRERIESLEKRGFIWVKPSGNRSIGYILILNPLMVAAKIRRENPSKVAERWWTMFVKRASEIGAKIPDTSPLEQPLNESVW